MVLEVCSYDECAMNIINIQDSQSNIDFLFFLLIMMLQQKRMDMLNVVETKKTKDEIVFAQNHPKTVNA
jgi:hypothetical protein